jgi:hypothetical protein
MTVVEDLKRSISQMSNDELFSRIKELRSTRRVDHLSKFKSKSLSKPKSPEQLINSLSSADLAALIKELEDLS